MTDRDLGRRPKAPLALRLGSAGAVGLAFLTWACGGAKGSSNHEFTPTPNNPSPTATEILPTVTLPESTATRIELTATLPPEATATPKELKKLSDATLPEQSPTADKVTAAIDAVYKDHPEAENFKIGNNSSPFSKRAVDNTWQKCQFGDPSNTAYKDNPLFKIEDEEAECSVLIEAFMAFYKQTGNEDYYNLAVEIYGFALGEIPTSKHQEFNNLLSSAGIK